MEFFIIWAVSAILTGIIAIWKGRNPVGWLVLSFFIGFIGLIIICCMPAIKDEQS
jgi:drug/metabolite transporter (DMT)-like permease